MKEKSTSQSAFLNIRVLGGLCLVLLGTFLGLAGFGAFSALAQTAVNRPKIIIHSDNPLVPVPFDCSRIHELGIDRQINMRAGAIMIACGEIGGSQPATSLLRFLTQAVKKLLMPFNYGAVDVNLITGPETPPDLTQSTTFAVGNPDNPLQMLVAYNDTRGRGASPPNGSGASWSTDGGNTFVRLTGSNGQSPFSGTAGNPVALYHRPTGTWYTIWADYTLCGGLGGYKTTTPGDATSWTHFCVASGSDSIDRASGWSDNNPGSTFYGRIYTSYNDFSVGGGALFVRWSSDGGGTWNPVQVVGTFIRNVQLTGDATNGNVYLMTMNEGGGGCGSTRQNVLYKSTDGGVTWTNTYTGATFVGPCRTAVGYFADMFSNPAFWRYMGWGQPAAYNNVVHYVYAACGAGGCPTSTGDPANVFYIRSTDGGLTFSAPFMLNTDGAPDKGQWEPSLSIGSDNSLLAVWYDERERSPLGCQPSSPSTPCYRMWARKSTDGGATWQPDMPFSDVVSPLPMPDPGIVPTYASDYDYANNVLAVHLHAWVDGRNPINGASQPDAYFDREPNTVLSIVGAFSRKAHGGAGSFDVNLPLSGSPGIECRTTGATGDYAMVATFSGNVTVTGNPQAQVTLGAGCVGSAGTCTGNVTVSGNTVTIPLTNIANVQMINVRLNGVNSAGADAPATDFTIPMSILIGDTNANGTVNAADVAQTKARLGQTVDATNFRSDVNANGSINAGDTAIVKQNSGMSLPP
jgi:hypothetical protein